MHILFLKHDKVARPFSTRAGYQDKVWRCNCNGILFPFARKLRMIFNRYIAIAKSNDYCYTYYVRMHIVVNQEHVPIQSPLDCPLSSSRSKSDQSLGKEENHKQQVVSSSYKIHIGIYITIRILENSIAFGREKAGLLLGAQGSKAMIPAFEILMHLPNSGRSSISSDGSSCKDTQKL